MIGELVHLQRVRTRLVLQRLIEAAEQWAEPEGYPPDAALGDRKEYC